MTLFTKAFAENKESEKIENLYKEAVSLYSKKVSFSFLIQLFIKVYNKKELCEKLFKEFSLKIDDKKNKERSINLEQIKNHSKILN